MAYIYQIRNTINDKIYIGSTNNYIIRWKQHVYDLSVRVHKNGNLQTDWDLFGKNCFEFKVLEEVPDSEQYNIEQKYLNKIFSSENQENFYNVERKAAGRKSSNNNLQRINIFLPEDFFKDFKNEAEQKGTNVSSLVRMILIDRKNNK